MTKPVNPNDVNSIVANTDEAEETPVVVVTGASKGLGADIVRYLARSAAHQQSPLRLVLAARDLEALTSLAAEVVTGASDASAENDQSTSNLVEAKCVQLDLSDPQTMTDAADALWSAFGHIDSLVNNAGISITGPAVEITAQDWQAVIAMNLSSPALLAANIGERMARRGGGRIVNVGSVAGSRALAEHYAYCSSKAGLIMAGKVLATELGGQGVRVNSVSPTVVLTEMGTRVWGDAEKAAPMLSRIANGHFAQPDDVASAVAYLLSPGADMINGQDIVIDGGFSAV